MTVRNLQPPTKSTRNPMLLRLALLGIILGGAALLGLLSFLAVRAAASAAAPAANRFPGELTPAVNAQGTPLPGAAANPNAPASPPQLTPWDGSSRVTVLLLGLDFRDWGAGDPYSRSDTMILLTLDPLTRSAGILSIPRDMWVAIPGFQHGKINTAYFLGDAYKLPGGGPGLAVKTVEQFLGVPVNYYAQIDFDTFVKFIDEIGGVKINVPDKLRIDLLGGGPKTQKILQPGWQVLPGEWALAYARQRYTQGGDFDRANRQQQVIMAVRDKVLSPATWPVLLAKAPTLYNQLSSGIHTNMTLQQALQLAQLAREVPAGSIQRGVLGSGYTLDGWSPDNLSILIPIPDKIHLLRDQIFAASDSLGPQTPGSPQEQMKAEAARVAVYNGSAASDLEGRAAQYLRQQGMNVTETGGAGQRYAATTLVDHTGSPYTLKYLLDTLKVQPGKILFKYDPNNAVDVEVYLGDDARGALP